MVYKKYIWVNGKRYGPYLYHNKRVDGKVVTSYHGQHDDEKIDVGQKKYLHYLLIVALTILFLGVGLLVYSHQRNVLLGPSQTVVFGQPNYELGTIIDGQIFLSEVPVDSSVSISLGDYEKTFSLLALIGEQDFEIQIEFSKEIVKTPDDTDSSFIDPSADLPTQKSDETQPSFAPSQQTYEVNPKTLFSSNGIISYTYVEDWEKDAQVQLVSAQLNGKEISLDSLSFTLTDSGFIVSLKPLQDVEVALAPFDIVFRDEKEIDLKVVVQSSQGESLYSFVETIPVKESSPSIDEPAQILNDVVFNGEPVLVKETFTQSDFELPAQAQSISVASSSGNIIVDPSITRTADSTSVQIDSQGESVFVEYELPAPTLSQEVFEDKIVLHTSGSSFFRDVDAVVALSAQQASQVQTVYWVEENRDVAYTLDAQNNLHFTVPHFSNQTFEIILISAAEHLDSNRGFISNIFEEVFEQDNVWSEVINDGEYVRVTFEEELDNTKDITIYPRIVSDSPRVEVYEKDRTQVLATFDPLIENDFNKIYLTFLVGAQDTFDLRVTGGSLEFDYIVDPTVEFTTDRLKSLDSAVLDYKTFVQAWCDSTNTVLFSMYESDGTILVNEQVVVSSIGNCDNKDNQLSVSAVNQSAFALAWDSVSDRQVLIRIFNKDGSGSWNVLADDDRGTNPTSVSVATLGNAALVVAWQDGGGSTGAKFKLYNITDSGSSLTPVTLSTPGNSISVSALDYDSFVVAWIDGSEQLFSQIFDAQGNSLTTPSLLDNSVGDSAKVEVSSFNATSYVVIWQDKDSDMIFSRIVDWSTLQAPLQLVQLADGKHTTLDVSPINETAYVFSWFNSTGTQDLGNYTISIYSKTGEEIVPSWIVDGGDLGTSERVVALSSKELGYLGTDLFEDNFVVSWGVYPQFYANWSTYSIDGTLWDGIASYIPLYFCGTLDQEGAIYILQNNLFASGSCITITADNIILDGSGYSITGDDAGFGDYGISVNSVNNVTLTNLTISNFDAGIIMNGVNNSLIYLLNLSSNDFGSLYNSGVYMNSTHNVSVRNSLFDNNYYGIYFTSREGSNSQNLIENNLMTDFVFEGIRLSGLGNIIRGNNLSVMNTLPGGQAIELDSSDNIGFEQQYARNNTIENNFIFGNDVLPGGIVLRPESSDNRLRNNSIIRVTEAIRVEDNSDRNFIEESKIISVGNAALFMGISTDSIIKNLEIRNSIAIAGAGIVHLFGGTNNTLENITITGTNEGVNDLNLDTAGEVHLKDILHIKKYELDSVDLDYEENGVGIIDLFNTVTGGGENLSSDIKFANNSVYINGTSVLNKSANVTLYNIGERGFSNPKILRDGIECVDCYNFTVLNATNVKFNVSGWSTYSIGDVITNPNVNFVSPTPPNATILLTNSVVVNVSSNSSSEPHYTFVDFDKSLVLWMRFDDLTSGGQPVDLSSYSLNGTLVGNSVINSNSKFGTNGLKLDNHAGNYVNLYQSDKLEEEITFSAWIKLDQVGNHIVFSKVISQFGEFGDSYPGYIFSIPSGGKPKFTIVAPNTLSVSTYDYNGNDVILVGSWNHVAVTRRNSGVKIYLNGAESTVPDLGNFGFQSSSTSALRIGSSLGYSGASGFNGSIDEALIFNRALSQSEIKSLYDAGANKYSNNFANLPFGEHRVTAYVVDSLGYKNRTEERVFYIINTPPNNPVVFINSTDGTNRSNQDLNCFATISEPDLDRMNVSVQWYKNDNLEVTVNYNNNYVSGTNFKAVLNSAPTIRGQNWSCGMRLFDGIDYSNWVNSTNITILNSPPEMTLMSPSSGAVINDRQPLLEWSFFDADGDQLVNSQINMTKHGNSLCTYENDEYVGSPLTTYLWQDVLNCFNDGVNGDYYNLSVRGFDGIEAGPWSARSSFTLQSYISITLINNNINFGQLSVGDSADTDNPMYSPFVIENNGNRDVNITLYNASDLWLSETNPTSSFQIKADTQESGSFDELQSNMIYGTLPSEIDFANWHVLGENGTQIITALNYPDVTDSAQVDVSIIVPLSEPPGLRQTEVTFLARLAGGDE